MDSKDYIEGNIDSLVGPSHYYAGLAYGNLAAMRHKGMIASPKKAALEGLNKMKTLMDLGIPQLVLPPMERPAINVLRSLGFTGTDEQCLKKAYKENKKLLFACCSAASMWMANSATVTPSLDSTNKKTYITIANLSSQFHRSIESELMKKIMQTVFDQTHIKVLDPIHPVFGDEGAANHLRMCYDYKHRGINIFIYGRESLSYPRHVHEKYPFRQSIEASQAIIRNHHIDQEHVIVAQQHPDAVQKGAFHADVLMVSHRYMLLCHEKSLMNQKQVLQTLRKK